MDWNPPHLYATIRAAYEHKGASFVRIFQRCPHFTSNIFAKAQEDPSRILMMTHPGGINLDPNMARAFPNRIEHDPSDLSAARALADREDVFTIGLFYRSAASFRYDHQTAQGLGATNDGKLAALRKALDRFLVS